MKIFVSYKFQGEDKSKLTDFLKAVDSALTKAGHEVFIYLKNKQNWGEDNLYLSYE